MKTSLKLVAAALIFFLLGLFVGYSVPRPSEMSVTLNNSPATSTVSLMLDFGDGSVSTFQNIPISGTSTLFDVLLHLSESDSITMTYDDYGNEMGSLVQSIDGYVNGDTRNTYWQIWVNNEYAKIGASHYRVSPGDSIEWKFINQLVN